MRRTNETWPLLSVIHYKNEINLTPEYQRYSVWSKKQKQLLMDSIFRGLDIPKLYLRQLPKESQFNYEAVDGQQRLRAVWEFFADEYPLSADFTPELGGKSYNDLSIEEKKAFDLYQFSLVVIDDSSDDEIREMFCRLQNGKPLNAAEKRNAMVSSMRDFCAELAEHSFFKSVRFGNKRMQHHQVAAQTVLLELSGKPTNTRKTNLEKLYIDNKDFNHQGKEAKRIKKIYGFLHKCFPERTPELIRGNFVSLYLLLSELMREYNLNGYEANIQKFLTDINYRRIADDEDREMVEFNNALKTSSDGEEAIRLRHETLLREFHKFIPDLIPLDSKRGFDEAQRIAIYRRDGGKCKYCGEEVLWGNFHADHVVAHSQAGPTTVENGWLACSTCNQKKGKKQVETMS